MTSKILVIDDDEAIRYMMAAILKKQNYRVTGASTVQQALDLLAKETPDVVCCDLMMPGVSGLDFLEHCRGNPALEKMPVIVVSAAGEEDVINQALTLGAFACLNKPFSKAQLLEIVASALESIRP